MFLYKIEAATCLMQVENSAKKFRDKFFKEYDLPMPRIKIVNQITAAWLGRCIYNPSVDKENTTLEIQKRITGDEKTLDRVICHELIHHVLFLLKFAHPQTGDEAWKKTQQDKRFGFKSDGHGKEFKEWAAKINAVMGADYVTEKSDMSYVTELDKEYFLLIMPARDKSKFSFAWMAKPSKDQQAIAQRWMMDNDAKIFMSKDERFIVPKYRIKKYGSTGIPLDPERQEFLKTMYHSGKAITPTWTKLITKLSDFAAPTSKGMEHILTKDPLGVLGCLREASSVSHGTGDKIVAQLTWADDYDDEDLGDAVDHYNYISNLNFGKGIDSNSIENVDIKLLDPKDILPAKIRDKKHVGWLKGFSRSSWVDEFKQVYGRDLTHILKAEDINLPIMIKDTLCDGYARVTLAYALGEKVPIAIFR